MKHVLDFLQLKSETLTVNTLKGYVPAILHRHALVRGTTLSLDPSIFHTEMDYRSRAHQRHPSYGIAYLVSRAGPCGPHQGPMQTHRDLPSQLADLENTLPAGYYLRTLSF